MNKLFVALFVLSIALLGSCKQNRGKARVLLFSKTADFKHSSIPTGIAAIKKLGDENDFQVDTTDDANSFNEDSLKNYAAVIFLNTTGDILNNTQQTALERYIQSGGGFVGVHAAADAEYDWRWYGRLVGGYFESHPEIQEATLSVKDKDHISTKDMPASWKTKDEWYNYKRLIPDMHVLITLDENSYKGGKNGANHPIAWYHEYDGGRAFYTGLGHIEEKYSDPVYLKHLLGGIKYAIGDNKQLNYDHAKSEYPPDEDRFTKTVLTQGTLFEPTEIAVLPNLDVLIGQRRGEIMLYKNETKSIKQVGFLNVYWKTVHTPNVNAEEGLLGLQADPNFKNNNFVYIYYSPADTSVNRLSRFEFKNDTIDPSTEKIILQLYSQREICCHTGGSIAFGKDRMLYLSTGDNSTPFDDPAARFVNHGFAPLDNRQDKHQYDARRSAGNTNDLRGKILRIKINDDGTYYIPSDNLFPGTSAETKPEIYVMGNRNPYRISVDSKTGFLYWGEVGPDASNDSLATRGPRGYDEVNQARKAGYFGWPLFIADNIPYKAYDYNTGVPGEAFNPQQPINNSPNNTGLQQLPPAQPAFIWYPYAASKEFPQVGSGGRTAMAGPVYHGEAFAKSTRYDDYYNDKLFIYEWIRGWIKVVTMAPNGDLEKIEPFMEHTKFSAPQDMELGPDGRLYVLEYGSGWFSKNADAGLSRIDYNSGNRPPKIAKLTVDKLTGSLPFKITAKVDAKDPENDKLTYQWDLGGGVKKETDVPQIEYTYNNAGDYPVSVTVTDKGQAASKSEVVNVYAGNETPDVDIQIAGNKSFYFAGTPVKYEVTVDDKNDTARTDPAELNIMADFVEGRDKAAVPAGHLSVSETMMGKNIMLSYDCKACHQVADKSVGPAYTMVAAKYKNDPKAPDYLVNKIRKGGAGVWGEVAMSAHPDVPENDLRQIVKWIMSLGNTAGAKKSLAPSGAIAAPGQQKGLLYLTATYSDKGAPGIKPLTGKKTIVLRNSLLTMRDVREVMGFASRDSAGTRYFATPDAPASLLIDSVDLSGITAAELSLITNPTITAGFHFEILLDGVNGKKIGEANIAGSATPGNRIKVVSVPLTAVTDKKFHNVYLVCKPNGKEPNAVLLQSIRFKTK